MGVDVHLLVDRLNPVCQKALESAADLCATRTHFNIEIEHLLIAMLDIADTDLSAILNHYRIEPEDTKKELTRAIDHFQRGSTRIPALSAQIIQLLEQAWLYSSLKLNIRKIRTGAILLALMSDESLRHIALKAAVSLMLIPRSAMIHEIGPVMQQSAEAASSDPFEERTRQTGETRHNGPESRSALGTYTVDLTKQAREGMIDPVLEREGEIRQIIDILSRRRQNNPILTGDAGVGKTAVVEGLALRIAASDVPPLLTHMSLRLLDLGLIQAGAGLKGEFEKRIKAIIQEVTDSRSPVILFIDEAHTLIGAGAPAGTADAANLLKPALSRGQLRMIAATTWSEYKRYFEKDPALARRFQVVRIDEPDEARAAVMLRGSVPILEKHHGVQILDEAVRDAVALSHRYITGRRLPDKAVNVLDTACARVATAQKTTPPAIADLDVRTARVDRELRQLEMEAAAGLDHGRRIETLRRELSALSEKKAAIDKQWREERQLTRMMMRLNSELSDALAQGNAAECQRLRQEMTASRELLHALQGPVPLSPLNVDGRMVASVVSDWTGIPTGRMQADAVEAVLGLGETLNQRIRGQAAAIDAICRRIRTYRAHMDDPGKPMGVFLLTGPSGVGKTQTAVALAEVLYGGVRNLSIFHMSEYPEAYSVSALKGSPPGYVGHGKGGALTETVRRRPYSVLLLDEIEKAHPDVVELLYPVFDTGRLEDSDGIQVDFKNSVILMTSTAGAETISQACRSRSRMPEADTLLEMIRLDLLSVFSAAFLGRVTVIPYYPLDAQVLGEIVRIKLTELTKRFRENHDIELTYGERVIRIIAESCPVSESGARDVDRILTHSLLPELSGDLLRRISMNARTERIHLYPDDDGAIAYRFDPPLPDTLKPELLSRPAPFVDAFPTHLSKSADAGPEKNGAEPGDKPLSIRKTGAAVGFFSRLLGRHRA